ncbi:hypothetical protein BJ965_007120 [Streptomyces luteogriseus]|uniref:Uncharacterized protein n=1 Tax=Streptomyces luteogriseus TaxID=68233 RepID=A0A7W7DV66_9ACTN|nr:hypothetical protein [Streptomyces luteogriseus]MBB4717238.1 hypothetical protein [Streptomyces luteogriseus]
MERAERRGIVGRGVRVGPLMACAPVLPWAALALGVALVEFLRPGGDTRLADRDLRYGGILTGGSLLAGVLTGLILAGGLALASRVVTRPWGLTLAGALVGVLAFPAVFAVVAIGTDGAVAQLGTTFLAWPVMTTVAAEHGSDIAGRTRRRPWLWPPGPAQGRRPAPMTADAGPERPYRAS